ncbi:MAG: hypothetical protein KF817_11175 [Phycisphaeraceae bacterium]|nr:hypothetical protein [Phycisphaeraceae bacterium]
MRVSMGHVAGALALALTGSVFAGPTVTINFSADDGTNEVFLPVGSPVSGSTYNFMGFYANANSTLQFDFNADPTVSDDGAFLGSGFTLQNLSNAPITYTIEIILDLTDTAGPITDYFGSQAFTLVGANGLFQGINAGANIWEAYADGNFVAGLFAGQSMTSTVESAGNLGDNVNGQIGPVMNTISLLMQFELSAGDTVTSTGAFGIIPTPSALALFGLAGLGGARRRRRN